MARTPDSARVGVALQFDATWTAGLQAQWRELIDIAVWGDLATARLGVVPRLRRRLLELGERLKSLTADRDWIPHPRERLKSALAAALGVRETLAVVASTLTELTPGPDAARLAAGLRVLQALLERELPAREQLWAQWLDAQLED
jgi:hypothetical protein